MIYVDIDNTICHTDGVDYENAVPMGDAISKINQLYLEGHEIVYWTARGAKTGMDWGKVTFKQLEAWGAMWDDLRFDKPPYDLLYDDKSLSKIS